MRVRSKEDGAKYVNQKIENGYARVNKWCPAEYKKTVNAIIDILSCHKEAPDSTVEFHEFIDSLVKNAEYYYSAYDLKNDLSAKI